MSTRAWTIATYKEFDEGKVKDAVITGRGTVLPGSATERVDLETEAAWTAVRAPDGTIYVGGVTDGAIFAVASGKKRLVASLAKDAPWIGALALAPDGTLYAGTLGSATIHAIDTRSGATRKLAALEGAEHVWALSLDPSGKHLFAGTGTGGKLFAVELPSGKTSVAWESGDKHILALGPARDGALWLGTSEEAILYRFDPRSGQARAVADFDADEIKALAQVEDAVVVAVNEFEAPKGGSPPTPPSGKGPKGTAAKPPEPGTGPGSAEPPSEPPRQGERKGKGALFRVEPDGRVEQLHALAEGYFQAVAAAADGTIYAAAGSQGRVYAVRPDRTVVTAFDVPERQVNALAAWGDRLAFATGDGGALYSSTGPSRDASYTSKVFDAQFSSRWGNLRWRGGDLTVETRSGNTAKPDRGWSEWEKVVGPGPAGGDAMLGRIASPAGRYLQLRATLDGPRAVLKETTAYYLPQNQRARVIEATAGEVEERKAAVTLASGPTKPRAPILKLKWKVENPDDDELTYTLEIQAEGDADWRALPTGLDPLTKSEFDWNTEAVADGHYRLRVSASDARSNPQELALTHAHVTPLFLVDNLRPQLSVVEVKYPFASGQAVDSYSRVSELAYSLDGGKWAPLFPKDAVFDSSAEAFTIRLPDGLSPGAHTLVMRAADEAGNIGSAARSFRVGR